MTYPSPYQPPGPPTGYDPYSPGGDLLAPARRSGVLMFILGGLGLAGSLCCIGVGAMLPRMMSEHPEMFREMPSMPGVTPEILRIQAIVLGSLILVVAISLLVLAPFVRRASKGAIITSIVISILAVLYLLLQIVISVVVGKAQGAAGACVMIVPLGLFGTLMMSLFQAFASAGQVQAMRDQYAQQYWQSAYQQQMYRGAIPPNAGFSPPPPPPPPPPPRGPDGPASQG